MLKPKGVGTIKLKVEDNLNDVHKIYLQDIQFLHKAPINIFVPQVFAQQHQAEGDSEAACKLSANAISLEWTSKQGKPIHEYIQLNKSNVGICYTTSGLRQFRAFATLCGMPPTFVSDDD